MNPAPRAPYRSSNFQPTDDARQAVVVDACLAGCSVSLVGVHQNLSDRTFAILPARDLLWALDVRLGPGLG
jgi:hypothetical protein